MNLDRGSLNITTVVYTTKGHQNACSRISCNGSCINKTISLTRKKKSVAKSLAKHDEKCYSRRNVNLRWYNVIRAEVILLLTALEDLSFLSTERT
jgi:hypothetical protein